MDKVGSLHCKCCVMLKHGDPSSSLHHPRHPGHLFALFGGVQETLGVSTVTPPVPASTGVDGVDKAVSDLREDHHDIVGLGQRKKSCSLNVAVAQPASLHAAAMEVKMKMTGELAVRTTVWWEEVSSITLSNVHLSLYLLGMKMKPLSSIPL